MIKISFKHVSLAFFSVSALVAGIYFYNSGLQKNIEKPILSQNLNPIKWKVNTSQKNNSAVDTSATTISENPARKNEVEFALAKKIENSSEVLSKEFDYGVNAPVESNKNAQTASVALALQDPSKYPERLSVAHLPKDFDRIAFLKNPKEYLNTIEPARVFQSAQPVEGVVAIERISEKYPVIKQKQSTDLIVKALPEMPVTFTSFDLGRFENDLASITVQAGKDGLAKCTFTASVGTIGKVNILASCPETSGQIKFIIEIQK